MTRPQRIQPGPGQESVWDYPRPPALEPVDDRVQVVFAGTIIAESTDVYRICETSHAPAYYIPRSDVEPTALSRVDGTSFCEWKGAASYYDVVAGGRRADRAAWTYLDPTSRFKAITGHVAFYAASMDECRVGDAVVSPMDGDFYGGWITPELTGPFKGAPGTRHW